MYVFSGNIAIGVWVTVYHGNPSEEPTTKRICGLRFFKETKYFEMFVCAEQALF